MKKFSLFSIFCSFLCSFYPLSAQEKPPAYGNWYRKELTSPLHSCSSKIMHSPYIISSQNLQDLKEYMRDTQFSGVVYLSDRKNTYLVCSKDFELMQEEELIFPIHSIGKVYTGILALLMLQNGIISENTLLAPLEIDNYSTQCLPFSVQQQLKTATLHATMVHKGGFGDYLGKYIQTIQQFLKDKKTPPILSKPEEFLIFADEDIYQLQTDETRYSNLGLLLVGLSIQHHYQKIEPLDYNAILQKYILDQARITLFFSKPDNGHFNELDPLAEHLCGSPAGGYWTTVKDLHQFGEWIRNKCEQEPDFLHLLEQYGQEFYAATNREIVHGGGIPSSSAFFSVFLDNGITIAIASNTINQGTSKSSHLYQAIVKNLLKTPTSE